VALAVACAGVAAAAPLRAPKSPPVHICGNGKVLRGPATPPAGAVRVGLGQNLGTLTDDKPAGTTFWLAPGKHVLGNDEYDQVIPKNGDVYIGAPGAVLDGQGRNRYAFTQHAKNVVIRNLTIRNFTSPMNEGVVNHDGGRGWRILRNTIADNDGAGLMIGTSNIVQRNCITRNGQYGFQAYPDGVRNLVIDRNEISRNNTGDWEHKQEGCGCTGGAKFWDVTGAVVTRNYVHRNHGVGLWADTNNSGFRFEQNWFDRNEDEALFYEISYNAHIIANTFVRNALVKGREFAKDGDSFPVGAVYISESGGDRRVFGGRLATLQISRNRFVDNWGGVVLWENSDRFCASDANTSSGYCTKVGKATLKSCASTAIKSLPLRSDCRWKTQNVLVSDNLFSLRPRHIACTKYCGQQAIIANYGTYPDWSPFMGRVVQTAITSAQHNRFARNAYYGTWRFAHFEPGNFLTFAQWRAAGVHQDTGSVRH
jgi:hypothetical protein